MDVGSLNDIGGAEKVLYKNGVLLNQFYMVFFLFYRYKFSVFVFYFLFYIKKIFIDYNLNSV